MGGRAGGGASGGMGSHSRSGQFTGTGGEVFYGGPGSKGWNESVKNVLAGGVAGMKSAVYYDGSVDNDTAYTVLAGVAAKSTGFQKDVATKGLKNMFDYGNANLTEKQSWAVSYEFKKLFS